MKGKKVWLISPFSPIPGEGWGGVKTHAEYLAQLLCSLGAELTVIVPEGISRPGLSPLGFRVANVPSSALPHTGAWRAAMRAAAERLAAESRPDVVFSEGYTAAGCESFLKSTGIPLAAFVHNFHLVHFYNTAQEISGSRSLLAYLLKTLPLTACKMIFREIPFYRSCRLVLPVSDFNHALLRRYYFLPEASLMTFHNWIDAGVFKKQQAIARAEFGMGDEDIVLVMTGSSWRPKGFHLALKAFGEAWKKSPNLRLIAIGAGVTPAFVHEQGLPAGAEKRVTPLGKIDRLDLPGIYSASDIFLLPSLISEACSYVLIEAMASGLPAISTDVGGNRERPMGAAMLVPPDHRSMSMAISRLALDRDMRAELGKLSIAAAEANYSVAAAAKNLNAVLKKLGLL
ncbi:MAG: hypothetical protein CVU79_02205 [Elusimicrobia bacterium HGW-Elusimicrobia-3]|nr:MAG: hypothetical protein CVU79_02205 [Elusimicrobia bacterium HGW-Elusimicrobia-3]